jgi:hypothetical protein
VGPHKFFWNPLGPYRLGNLGAFHEGCRIDQKSKPVLALALDLAWSTGGSRKLWSQEEPGRAKRNQEEPGGARKRCCKIGKRGLPRFWNVFFAFLRVCPLLCCILMLRTIYPSLAKKLPGELQKPKSGSTQGGLDGPDQDHLSGLDGAYKSL